jgi:peptide deformylase
MYIGQLSRIKVKVQRPKSVRIKYFNAEGEELEREFSGFGARLILHEIDHLLGIPFIDWKVSQGEIEILEEHIDKFNNLSTVLILISIN